ncbi:hypothetical protein AVT69_gp260 [Pseudomonas phage PhiPA3]|uniref:Uncharacterized protein 262 n=1 Tax=Pseudomonas phage PhiPA3 TaxID=998086 RepID=F8SJA1_BPPA3|nr:hypothetical protein AVT69_gp260 [Pseudomonas phage PhiPA3]AEH03685.1 hypothetical protein [Pseudomonas phage PhiPA3]
MNSTQKVLIIDGGSLTTQMTAALIATCKRECIEIEEYKPCEKGYLPYPDLSGLNRNLIPYFETEESGEYDRVPTSTYEKRQFKKSDKQQEAAALWLKTAYALDHAKTKEERHHIVKGYKSQRRILRLQHAGVILTRLHECTLK